MVDDPAEIQQIYDYGWTVYGGGTNVCRFGNASLLIFFLGGAQCYLAAENLALAAYGLGYGSCLIGGMDRKRIKALLGIPEENKIQLFVAVGLADEERSNAAEFTAGSRPVAELLPYAPEARKPLAELVHRGRYGTLYTELGKGRTRDKLVGKFSS
jgi:nitroreductase